MPVDLTALRVPRPHRADAARNFDAVLAAAGEVFSDRGFDAPLEDVARRAGVGIATVYRNFPTREQLVENVYVTEVQYVLDEAAASAQLPPWEGLTRWLRRFVEYLATKRAVANAIDPDSAVYRACRDAIAEAGRPLLERAQAAGEIRNDIDEDDIARYIMGAAGMNFSSAAQRDRMLGVLFDGLRAR
ncbi:MAG TPA: helix-turn-helix domain-containing protein [Solirubrobacteraceae bacterium]|jgi:AcrR family transcriptional regulator